MKPAHLMGSHIDLDNNKLTRFESRVIQSYLEQFVFSTSAAYSRDSLYINNNSWVYILFIIVTSVLYSPFPYKQITEQTRLIATLTFAIWPGSSEIIAVYWIQLFLGQNALKERIWINSYYLILCLSSERDNWTTSANKVIALYQIL